MAAYENSKLVLVQVSSTNTKANNHCKLSAIWQFLGKAMQTLRNYLCETYWNSREPVSTTYVKNEESIKELRDEMMRGRPRLTLWGLVQSEDGRVC